LRQDRQRVRLPQITALRIAHGGPRFRNRNEKEFAGYRDAIEELTRHIQNPLAHLAHGLFPSRDL
jgi:hypothetical protein